MKISTTGRIIGSGNILVTVTKTVNKEGSKNFPVKNYTQVDGKTVEDKSEVVTKPEDYKETTTDTFNIDLNNIKIELNQETNADADGADVIKAVWKALSDAIMGIKESLTR